jgi:hypothetical protein
MLTQDEKDTIMSNEKVQIIQEFFSTLLQKRSHLLHSTEEEISEVYAKSKDRAKTCKELTKILQESKTDKEILEAIKKL